ncbi:MAG: 50S ribosomal protein L11 methyltransferase [Synergistaceae bacterium]|nr:50S ribosomal protein L11 methyltransferase [Synergistaceae bacterium]
MPFDSFWWSVELEAGPGVSASEETLWVLADLSGSIGAELLEEEGRNVLRAAYLSSRNISCWLALLEDLLKNFPGVSVRSHTKIENRPWNTAHIDAFPPLPVGAGLVVMAPWHKGKEPSGRIPLYIYPSSAFGTGYHESTRIALTLTERFIKKGDTIVDIGTGSGILFIAALKLGAAKAVARDIDPAAVAEALRNMNLNGLPPDACDLRVGYLLQNVAETDAGILTANILLEPNLRLLSDVRRVLRPSGVAVFSGITETERSAFLSAMPRSGTDLLAEITEKTWWGCAVKFV